ncbi:RNA binding protein Jsn1 [Pseudohyphozyma bogoriensis]|nr:RNA binding protein Jsn1 [Pseudohyphozyma bogoriensis]
MSLSSAGAATPQGPPGHSPTRTSPQLSAFDPLPPPVPPAAIPPPVAAPQISLHTVQEDPLLLSPPGLSRRPRADTLPSTFHIGTTSPGVALRHLNSTTSGGLLGPPIAKGASASLPGSGSSTPISEYPFASALGVGTVPSSLTPPTSSTASSRLRSGSLTLPSSGLSNAFGPSVFSSGTWTPQTTPGTSAASAMMMKSNSSGATSGGGGSGSGRPEVVSPDPSAYGDDSHVRTLDYLGLDGDSPIGGFGPFSEKAPGAIGEGSSRGSLAVGGSTGGAGAAGGGGAAPAMHRLSSVGNLASVADSLDAHHGRMRSNTVATFPRSGDGFRLSTSPFPTSTLSGSSSRVNLKEAVHEHEEDYFPHHDARSSSSYHRSSDSSDSTRLLYSSSATTANPTPEELSDGFGVNDHLLMPTGPGSRARAATIGILDEKSEMFLSRKRAGTTVGLPSSLSVRDSLILPTKATVGGGANASVSVGVDSGSAASVLSRGIRGLSLNPEEGTAWSSSRPLTPEGAGATLTPPPQLPTRSLWIGNLDPKTTPAELQSVFAPYGPIESLRLIPEKECGFVNFVSVADAIHAKEDVLNRLGGQLTKTSGMVRIGFGKAEAAPATMGGNGRGQPNILGGNSDLSLQTSPTRALWVGSIPSSTTPNHLLALFGPFGPVESARVLTHKSCGFINFERLEDAVTARKALNGRELLGPEVGPVRIGFAKVPTKALPPSPYDMNMNGLLSTGVPPLQRGLDPNMASMVPGMVPNGQYAGVPSHPGGHVQTNGQGEAEGAVETVVAKPEEMAALMRDLVGESEETEEELQKLATSREPVQYYTAIPTSAITDPTIARRYVNADAPRLREIRKRLDSPQVSIEEIDSIAYELADECVGLASDYIGRTRSDVILVPSTHKNGTWAVQKIISSVQEPEEFALIEMNLKPYTPPLLLNDFGNYVVQGALRFESPTSDFIFNAMEDRIWDIGSGRFGARSTRQTLESPLASRFNVKRVAIAIILNSVPLATSSNGALLITWLLDTSNFAGRYRLLAPRFAAHLPHLCTHKLASLAVLKIINQKFDPESARLILEAMFDAETKTLEDILGDQMHGAACIAKVLQSTFIEQDDRARFLDRIRAALTSLRVQTVPSYRKLLDEVGIPFQGPPAGPSPTSPYGMPYQTQQPPQHGAPAPSWSPQLNQGGYPPYTQFDYPSYPMGYPQFSQPGSAYPYFNPSSYAPPSFGGSPGRHSSPMLAPVPMAATAPSAFSPVLLPASLPPGVGSPDPFTALRVSSADPHSGFNPAFSPVPNPYFQGAHFPNSDFSFLGNGLNGQHKQQH